MFMFSFFFSLVFCVVSIIMTSIAASVLGTLYITEQSTKTPSVFPPGQVPTPPWIGVRWLNSGCRRKKPSGGSKRRPAWRPDLHPAPWSRARPCPLPETPLPSWTRWTDRSREGGCSDISYKPNPSTSHLSPSVFRSFAARSISLSHSELLIQRQNTWNVVTTTDLGNGPTIMFDTRVSFSFY